MLTLLLRVVASESAREDAAEVPRRPASDQTELQPKPRYHVNPRDQYETVAAGPVGGSDAAGATVEARSAAGIQGTREDEKQEPDGMDVREFAESIGGAVAVSPRSELPSLEEILTGEQGLLYKAQAPRVTVAVCKTMHKVLMEQGCVSTAHLMELLQFSRRSSVRSAGGEGGGSVGSVGGAEAVAVLTSMGIGAFHAMALVKYIDSVEAQ